MTWAAWRARLEVAATVGVLAVCIVLLGLLAADRWSARRPSAVAAAGGPEAIGTPPGGPASLVDAPILGDPEARLVIIEFADFQCPYCARFYRDTLPALKALYIETGQAQLAFRHLPLESIHPLALKAAEAAECARQQGSFWEMHDLLFDGRSLAEADLHGRARELGLNEAAFTDCLQGDTTARIRENTDNARPFMITGTPGFLVGVLQNDGSVDVKAMVAGAKPLADFERVIEPLLASGATEG